MYCIRNLQKSFKGLQVLDGITTEFLSKSVTSIIGPSGCGKSTFLNILSGLLKPYDGEIIGFLKENISFVFQEDYLIEFKTLFDNLYFVLQGKIDKLEAHKKIEYYLKKTQLWEYKNYFPRELSGGMRQRASIARAFLSGSNLILMDEPFKFLDIVSKENIIHLLVELIVDKTVIMVTHDIKDAIMLSDRVIVFSRKPTKIKDILEIDRERLFDSTYISQMEKKLISLL